jgi:hypothetical protein
VGMKAAAALVILAGFGFLVGHAQGDLIPIPTVPTVTVKIPTATTVKIPTVSTVTTVTTVPTMTTPRPPALPKAPAPTIPKAPTPTISAPKLRAPVGAATESPTSTSPTARVQSSILGGSSDQGSSTSSGRSSSSGGSKTSGSAPERAGVTHFQSSRSWIGTSGTERRRTTTLTFVLANGAWVTFTVKQLSPECRAIGHFTVRGHRGLNRVRFDGRVGGRQLGPGTYRITARTRTGRLVQRVIVVIVSGSAPTKAELADARASNVCSSQVDSIGSATTGASNGLAEGTLGAAVGTARPSSSAPKGSNSHSGVLASAIEKTARALEPALVALLAAAIVLLGLASLPRMAFVEPRFGDALVRHRTEIASLGAVALLAVIVAFLLG